MFLLQDCYILLFSFCLLIFCPHITHKPHHTQTTSHTNHITHEPHHTRTISYTNHKPQTISHTKQHTTHITHKSYHTRTIISHTNHKPHLSILIMLFQKGTVSVSFGFDHGINKVTQLKNSARVFHPQYPHYFT